MSTKSKIAKALALVVGASMVLALVGVTTPAQAALSASDLQAIIAALGLNSSQSAALQSLTGATSGTASCSYVFTKNLSLGSKGTEVTNLQVVLNMDSETALAVPAGNVGSAGHEGTTFGPATRAAVLKFQAKNGISKVGNVGPVTRAALNEVCSSTVSTVPGATPTPVVTAAGSLTVLAGVQPIAKLAPHSASRVPFTTLTLTAGASDVVVNGVNVQRTGQSQDAAFAGIVLLDENGIQIGISKTLNSNHQVTVGEMFTIKAGTTRNLTIAGNMASDLTNYTGQLASLTITGVNVAAGTVSGSFPITGAAHTLNQSLSLGGATLYVSSFDPNTASTKEIGTNGYRFAGIRVQANSTEDIRLWSVRWNQTGSVSSNDLANVVTYVDGVGYPTVVSADGKYFTSVFPAGIVIGKGNTKDLYIQADIIGAGASGRTVQFDLYRNTDLYISGELYGYGIIGTPNTTGSVGGSGTQFTTGTPFFDGSLVTINAGTVTTITKATSVAAQNIAVNVPNQPLGGYEIDLKGEPVSVQNQVFHFNGTAVTSSLLLTNVALYDSNGALVAGPVDAVAEGANQKVTFTDTVTYPVGKKVYTLKGKIASSAGNNSTVTASTTPSSDWTNITGQTSGNNISLSALTNQVQFNQMTVRAASLAISMGTNITSQTIVAGGTSRVMANLQLDANQSGEDLRFSNVALTLAGSGTASNLTGCQLFDGATPLNTGSSVVNPTTGTASNLTFTFDQSLTVPKGTVKSLSLQCNVSGNASGTFIWSITGSQIAAISATGITSSNTVTPSGSTSNSGTFTIGSSSLTIALDPSSPTYAVVAGGSTNVPVSAFKFKSSSQGANLERVGLKLTYPASTTPADLVKVTIWDGSTKVGEATFNGSSNYATSTLSQVVALTSNTDKILTIKADLAQIGQDLAGTSGHLIVIDYNANDTDATRATGADSGTVLTNSGSTASAGQRVFKTFPTFTYSTTGTTANNGAVNDLLSLVVTANAAGDVALNKLTFSVSTTTATLTTPTFIGPSGSVGTVALNAAGTAITVTFDSVTNTQDKYIAAGQSRTFTLRGLVTLTGTNTTGSVAVALKADTAFPSLASTFMSPVADASLSAANIIWSPQSTTTSIATTNNDWTNGYGLPGCFTTTGLGQDCTVRTVSK